MEPTLAFSVLLASLLAAVLVVDAIRSMTLAHVPLRWAVPLRAIRFAAALMSVIAATGGTVRIPASATTPPPSVRLIGAAPVDTDVEPRVSEHEYRVQPGDCLWRIARGILEHRGMSTAGTEVARAWRAIYDVNRTVVGDDPDLIHPGQVLEIPEEL